MTDKRNWQEKPGEGESSARRDGDRFSGSGNTWRKPSDNRRGGDSYGDRPRRSFSDSNSGGYNRSGSNSDRPRRSFGDNNDRPQRSSGDSGNRFNGFERPQRSFEDTGFEKPRRSYGDNSFEKPRRSFNEGGDRPRRTFGDNNDRPKRTFGDSNDRPRRSFGENNDRPRRSFGDSNDRPRRSFGENNDRPRRSFGENNDRPRRSFGDSGNSFDGFNREGGFEKPRRSFGDDQSRGQSRPDFKGPSLPRPDRADGRPRRPRIKKESGFDHGTPYGRSGNQQMLDPNEPIRLNKFLANAGICSRREADEFIQAGVVKVNGETVTELGVKVKPIDTILFHDQPVSIERKVYILLNKPKDCVTTSDDPQERLTVMDLVKGACYERIYPVGRLDRNTTGVLLLTNDGDLASKLTHPKYEKRKIYQVTLDNNLREADFATILDGVTLDGELIKVDNLSYVDPDKKSVIGIEIHSGQNRVVRRIFESLGYKVFKLDRVYFAGLTKKNLPRGKWRHLTDKEVSLLKMGAFV